MSYDPRRGPGGLAAELVRLDAQAALTSAAEIGALADAGVADGMHVIDLGCGSGAFLARMARAWPASTFVGVDHDPDLLERARAATGFASGRVRLCEGSIEALPAGIEGGADAVVARFVFQHLSDPASAARALSSVLVPGGIAGAIDVDGALWGIAAPEYPRLSALHARAWSAQSARGGNRFVGRDLWRHFTDAGYADVRTRLAATHSDEVGVDAFLSVIDPSQHQGLVAEGVLSLDEYAEMVARFQSFRRAPRPYLLTVSFVTTGRRS